MGVLERCNPGCVLGENSGGFGVKDWFLRLSFDHWRGGRGRWWIVCSCYILCRAFEGWMGFGEAIDRGNKGGFHVKHSRLDGVEQRAIYKRQKRC